MSSEIAQLRQQLVEDYLVGKRGLSGLAYGKARHDFITHQTVQMYHSQQRLEAAVGPERAKEIIIETFASLEGEGHT